MFQKQLKKFRDFAMKGNVVDMAVGIVIGAAFGKIATSLVNDLIMPPIGLLLGRVDFNSLFLPLDGKTYASLDAAKKAGAATFNYGAFINNVLDFARLERGEKKYNFQPCDLVGVVRETAETYRPHLETNGFKFECQLPATALMVNGDRDALAQVIVAASPSMESTPGTATSSERAKR